ncbi:hypothetical protein [Flavobacterium sp. WC2509]|uniref:hypothetical protein n=1 Tax=Flavobacterium sp. WC2509 TaxID=3461406 RepID=UPI0040450B65
MKAVKCLFLVILVFLIYSCNDNKPKSKQTISYKKIDEPNPKKAISDLVVKFPQLIDDKNVKDREFKLIRTVIAAKTKVQIQLYSQDKYNRYRSVKKPNQIIVFINKNNKCVAIPFFDNMWRGYWQFTNEKSVYNVNQPSRTFEKEYNYAISLLEEGSKFEKENIAINVTMELFESVLHLQPINDSNRNLEICKKGYGVTDVPIENEDSVKVRFEKNYKDIKKDLKNYSFGYYYDSNSYRIYGINYDYKEQKFKFKVYRQDCGVKPIQPIYM